MTDIVFMGTPELSAVILRALILAGYNIQAVVTQPDRPSGRKREIVFSPVKQLALEHDIKLLQPSKVRDPKFIKTLEDLDPVLLVTAAYGQILPKEILDIPHASINVHASLLPEYRGASPIQRAIFDGKEKTGVTIMLMDEGMDTGDILTQTEVAVPDDMNAESLTELLAAEGASLLVETIPDFLTGKIKPQKQDESLASTIRPVLKKEGRIDWDKSARDIHNLIRGALPWPVAYTSYEGKRVSILKSRVPGQEETEALLADGEIADYKAGSLIVADRKTRLLVKTGEGIIEILNLKMAGCRDLCSHECAHNFQSGEILGGDCR